LIAQERQDPTTAATVRDRYRDLILIVSKALKSSVPVNNVLSREEGQRLESLINSGSSNSAVDGVHAAIMKLYLISSSPARQNNQLGQAPSRDRMVAPTYPGPENNIVTPALFTVDVYRLVTAGGFENILKLMNPVIDQERRRLYISGTKSSFFGVVDLDKDELIDTFDMGIPGGFLILDPSTGVVYLMDISNNRYFRIDFGTRKAVAIAQLPSTVSLPKRNVPRHYKGYDYHDTGYPFTVGYLQNENASYGIITIKDTSGKTVTSIKHGPDALYFDIDQKTGKLYASNTGDGSISIFDLNSDNRKIKDIHVGIAIEKLILAPDSGGLFIANRLGGSALYHYNTETKSLVTIPNENTAGASGIGLWPTELVADDDTIYVLSHFAGRIDVVDAATNRVTKHIPLDLTYRPRTDALSSMAMDRTNKILYAAFPELGEIAAIDARAGTIMRTIKLDGVDITTSGPGGISLGVDDRVNRLFVYVPGQKALHVYDSTSLKLLKSLDLDAGRGSRIVTPNPEKKVVYVGNTVVDVLTLEVKSQFPPGERVIAFYNPTNRVYLARLTPRGAMNNGESVLEYDNGNIRREWSLPSVLSIPSTFAFDFKNNVFYAGQFERAVIQAYDMKSRP
jgi:DNA-binding beta-propeller fold protein YncE